VNYAEWNASPRTWFVFEIPVPPGITDVRHATLCYAPHDTVAAAREALRRSSYKGAPVDRWPCVDQITMSRDELSARLLRGDKP
jgi:hypothetical protein